ncbi:MAG: endo-1,4-beta-xylanase [Granulosicoccus sp.]|jgi:endo-1,4-beta-xylanase
MIKRTTDIATAGSTALRISVLTFTLFTLYACGSSSPSVTTTPPNDSPSTTGGNTTAGDDGAGETDSGNTTSGETTGTDGSSSGADDTDGNGTHTDGTDNSDGSGGSDDGTMGTTTGDNGTGTGETTLITSNRVLSPLPSPALTPAPNAESEPVRATGPVSTVREFFLVRNPTPETPDTFAVLTDEDFAAGPLPAVIETPAHVDPTKNSPPYFVDLSDVEIFAGQELNLVLKPRDPDGGVPGLFPYAVPSGADYFDNLDGSRSLIWRPLQPEVGIHEFKITATDPVEPYYRTVRTVRIKVSMPSDPSTIVNLPPVVNLIRDTTVRVNDPVVLYIKVDDQNATIPTLEIVNPPPGATITPHFNDPKYTILRFTPRVAETISLELLARDEIDQSLSSSSTVSIEVLEENAFVRPGTRLRELAAARDVLFGYAALLQFYEQPDGAVYADIAAEEFNLVTTENSLKWDRLNPLPGKYRWAQADNLVAHAKARRQAVHGHTLIWHRQLPTWIRLSDPSDRETHMREFIERVLTRYGNDIPIWDVVNEALEEDGTFRQSIWFDAMGAQFIDTAFRQARASAPDATLIYNDYDVSWAGPKADGLIALMQSLKDANTPVDGVGFQMHLDADFDLYDEVTTIFQTIADLDLDIYITELDVSIRDGQTEEQQAKVFEDVLSVCLTQPRCKAYQTWGFTDQYSWRAELSPLILDKRYQVKPAYLALQKRLMEN